jgi:hypothetical protein
VSGAAAGARLQEFGQDFGGAADVGAERCACGRGVVGGEPLTVSVPPVRGKGEG